MSTKEGRKKAVRVTPLDIALILLVVLIVISIWQKNNIQHLFEKQKQERSYTVTFEIQGMRVPAAELLAKDTALYFYDGDKKVSLGRLADTPLLLPYTQDYVNAQGNTVTMVYPTDDREQGRVVFSGAFVCYGIKNGNVLVHDEGLRMEIGECFLLATELGDFEAKVVSFVEIQV